MTQARPSPNYQAATALAARQRKIAEAYRVTVEVLLAEIVPQLVATARRRMALRKARTAAMKTLRALNVDVPALPPRKHKRATASAANRLVARTIRKLDGHVSRPPRADRTPKPEGSAS